MRFYLHIPVRLGARNVLSSGLPTFFYPPIQVPSLSIETAECSADVGHNRRSLAFQGLTGCFHVHVFPFFKPRGRPLRLSFEHPLFSEYSRPQYLRAEFPQALLSFEATSPNRASWFSLAAILCLRFESSSTHRAWGFSSAANHCLRFHPASPDRAW